MLSEIIPKPMVIIATGNIYFFNHFTNSQCSVIFTESGIEILFVVSVDRRTSHSDGHFSRIKMMGPYKNSCYHCISECCLYQLTFWSSSFRSAPKIEYTHMVKCLSIFKSISERKALTVHAALTQTTETME
jgi:hypothetical protein